MYTVYCTVCVGEMYKIILWKMHLVQNAQYCQIQIQYVYIKYQ